VRHKGFEKDLAKLSEDEKAAAIQKNQRLRQPLPTQKLMFIVLRRLPTVRS